MPFIKPKCKTCGKVVDVKSTFEIAGQKAHYLQCGHILLALHAEERDPTTIRSLDGKALLPFQVESVHFLERANGSAILTHEPGLGKTVCCNAFLALHEEMLPAMFICKATLKSQLQREFLRWTERMAQVIDDPHMPLLPSMSAYILSYDLLRRFKNGSLKDQVTARGIKTLILDECQQIKNPASQRTVSCREIAELVPNVMALSGTPIRNHAGEYFPVLNMVAPERYSNYNLFVRRDLDSYHTRFGYKVGGLRDPEGFLHKNADIIFRKTRAEVLPELPTIDRHNQFCDLGKEVEKQYIETFRKFQNEYNSAETMAAFERQANILAFLSKMRHLTGLSKINPCIDFCMEFLGGTDRKLTIFLHHKDVMEILKQRLGELLTELDLNPPLTLQAGDSASEVVAKFNDDPRNRILLASTLASGEGVDGLQSHSDLIILERQWNPMNEEQVEGRFSRIGGQTEFKSVTATYFIAIGTVDEFFTELVERKREIVYSTLDGRAIEWDQSSLITELAEAMAVSGGKQWGI